MSFHDACTLCLWNLVGFTTLRFSFLKAGALLYSLDGKHCRLHWNFQVSPYVFVGFFCVRYLPDRYCERRSVSRRVAKIVRATIHRFAVVSFQNQVSCGVLFCVGPEQDLKRLPWFCPRVWTIIWVLKSSPGLEDCWIVYPPAVTPSAVRGR